MLPHLVAIGVPINAGATEAGVVEEQQDAETERRTIRMLLLMLPLITDDEEAVAGAGEDVEDIKLLQT
jgi:hypothetical protein